jgi:glyoxalase/bleomycin resistance protein/dioxygenase superfamily protein
VSSSLLAGLRIVQVALVTADLERCASEQSRLLGNGPWRVYELGAQNIRDYTLHREPATGSTLLALNGSSPQVEILQPLDGTSTHRESLERDGEGIHHVAALVPSVADAVAVAEANGIEVVASGWGFGQDASGSFAYLDTRPMMGTLLEVFEPPTSLGEPLRVI